MYTKTIDFSKYSSIKVGQPTEVLMMEKDDEIPKDRYLIGGANNLLISPTPPPLMMLSKDYGSSPMQRNITSVGLSFAQNYLEHWAVCWQ